MILHCVIEILAHKHTICSYVVLFSMVVSVCFGADTCIKDTKSPNADCRCLTKNDFIDLSPLIKNVAQHEPLFKDKAGTKGEYKYSYNPCLPFTEGTGCTDVAVCQKTKDASITLGKQDTATFHGDPSTDSLYIVYTSGTGSENRTTTVHLKCTDSSTSTFSGAETATTRFYNFTLSTKYACLKSHGLSTGSILVIVFFVLLLVYIVGGILFLRFARGARGFEQIPNYTFWADLPFLVKDGSLFVFRGCKTDEQAGYNQI